MVKQPASIDALPASLNDTQREAAAWREGALLVLAGPGSGKTRVLTARIAQIIEESPDEYFRVLALTFTNRAADEMRERIHALSPGSEDRIVVGTFHSFCADVLRQHGQHLGFKTDFQIYSTKEDLAAIARRAIRSDFGRQAGLSEEDVDLLSVVARAKAKLLPCDKVAEFFRDPERGRRVSAFYTAYDAELTHSNALDFSSLIFKANEIFKRFPALARPYRSVYRYWCIDEFQDTTFAQYQLLVTMAAGEFREIFAVADDDQIIYEWNGADYRRLDQFRSDFDSELIQILTNFRCPSEVVECANHLIRNNLLRTPNKKPLVASRNAGESSVVTLLRFDSEVDEAEGVARHIVDHRSDALNDTVILGRSRRLLEPSLAALAELGVGSRIVARRDEFQTSAFIWLHNALRLAVRRTDERILSALVAAFNDFLGLSVSSSAILTQAETERSDLLTTWRRTVRTEVDHSEAHLLVKATQLLGQSNGHAEFADAAIAIAEELSCRDQGGSSASSEFLEDRAAWVALSAEVGRAIGTPSELERFLQELDLRSKEPPLDGDILPLMTIHGAKGGEFKHVYLIGLAEDILPSFQSKKRGAKSPQLEEERRNCFVAVTRCQETLTLSYAARYRGWAKEPSRFIGEMGLLGRDGR